MQWFEESFINELLSKVEMIDVMSKYGVQVRVGSARNHFYVASFCCGKRDFDNGRIRKDTQRFFCMSCGYGGNAIQFLRDIVGRTFHEAIVELAEMASIDLPISDSTELEKRQRKEEAFSLAAKFYAMQEFNNHEYLLNRGLSIEVIKRHNIGYAPGGRALRNYLESKGYTKQELLEYKLINSKGLDTLFYRAVIPVYLNKKVIDLYGRAVDDKRAGIKHLYINGDDILGGFDNIKPDNLVILYESAIDRLVAESHDVTNGIDSGGAKKFSTKHARMLKKKNVSKVMVVYDGDRAGREGSLETGQILIEQGIENVWIGELPEGTDPAKIIKEKGKDEFFEIIKRPKTFEKYKMYHELSKYSLRDIEEYLTEMKAASPN